MLLGTNTAISEITLVLFTTMAPAGAVAYVIMAFRIFSDPTKAVAKRIKPFLSIPLVVAMVGLVASATHLGNPSNALYVLLGVGSSPLSNEVVCAVAFLGLAAGYWLYSFTQVDRPAFERVWICLIAVASVLFITAVGMAYSVDTIVSWDLPLVPVNQWFSALVGGFVLALASLGISRVDAIDARDARHLLIAAIVIFAISILCQVVQGSQMQGLENYRASMNDLLGWYLVYVVVYAICGGSGLLVLGTARLRGRSVLQKRVLVGTILVFAGIFVIRFAFYMAHMTVGLSV